MKDTLRLGRIAGVSVGLHWSLLVIAGLLTAGLAEGRFPGEAPGYSNFEYVGAAAVTTAVFLACVLAHEVSHAVVARREKIGVDGITLWLLGGVTRMTTKVMTPEAELAISGIGPLTNLVLGVVLGGAGIAFNAAGISPLLVDILRWLGVINVVLAILNILPGAPLDGGRLLHAIVWHRHGDPLRATRVATRAGAILGAVLIGIGLAEFAFGTAVGGGLSLVLIGWYLRVGARVEEAHAEAQHALEDFTVADVTTRDPLVAPGWLTVAEFVASRRTSLEEALPVEDRDGTLLGTVSARQLRLVPRGRRTTTRVGDIVRPLSGVPTFGTAEPAAALLDRTAADDDGLALVLDADRLVGAVRRRDLARVTVRNQASATADARAGSCQSSS